MRTYNPHLLHGLASRCTCFFVDSFSSSCLSAGQDAATVGEGTVGETTQTRRQVLSEAVG